MLLHNIITFRAYTWMTRTWRHSKSIF